MSLRVASVPLFGQRSVDACGEFITEKIAAAGKADVDIVVFPETATNCYSEKTMEQDREAIESWIPKIQAAVRETAGPWAVVGTFTYHPDRIHNSALVIDPDGELRATYHKISNGGTQWLMAEIHGVLCTVLICADLWVPNIMRIPRMLGAQVCLYPHASAAVAEDRIDWSALHYARAWESDMFLVMADCSWYADEPYERPKSVPYPYDFTLHQPNQSAIIHPAPRYLARAHRDEQDGMLIADIDPDEAKERRPAGRYTVDGPLIEMLETYKKSGAIQWME